MERIEDKSKALSYIGIEIADALKYIPAPVEEIASVPASQNVINTQVAQGPRVMNRVQNTVQNRGANIAAATIITPPSPQKNNIKSINNVNPILTNNSLVEDDQILNDMYMKETRFDVKPSLWQRIKNAKLFRAIRYIMKIRVVLEFPALPEGKEQ